MGSTFTPSGPAIQVSKGGNVVIGTPQTFTDQTLLSIVAPVISTNSATNFYNTGDSYPHISVIPYGTSGTNGADNNWIAFDSYYTGSWNSSSSNGAFAVNKQNNYLNFYTSNSSGAITWAPAMMIGNDSKLYLGDATSSTSFTSPSRINLHGVDSNATTGPTIQAYTSVDSYPLMQYLHQQHNNIALCFDAYWNQTAGNWQSSYLGSNFQIYKNSNALNFNYGEGNAQGSNFAWSTLMTLTNAGGVNLGVNGGQVNVNGNPAVAETTSTVTTTSSGCIAHAFKSVFYKHNNIVNCYLRDISSSSSTTSSNAVFITTIIPTGYIPTYNCYIMGSVTYGGYGAVQAAFYILTSGEIVIYLNIADGGSGYPISCGGTFASGTTFQGGTNYLTWNLGA